MEITKVNVDMNNLNMMLTNIKVSLKIASLVIDEPLTAPTSTRRCVQVQGTISRFPSFLSIGRQAIQAPATPSP